MGEKLIDKWALRNYLNDFDLNNSKYLAEKADEILSNVNGVMTRYRELPKEDILRKYYEPDVKRVEDAYRSINFKTEFPFALDMLIAAITYE